MYYSTYFPVDFVNGEGVRSTLFVSGCNHKCKGCHNMKTWRPDFGMKYTKDLEDQIIADLQDEKHPRQGLSLTGGDPLFSQNLPFIHALVKRVKDECPGKDIWMWSGYTIEELAQDEKRSDILQYVDVLIDGKFEIDKRDVSLPHRGSSNQRVHRL